MNIEEAIVVAREEGYREGIKAALGEVQRVADTEKGRMTLAEDKLLLTITGLLERL